MAASKVQEQGNDHYDDHDGDGDGDDYDYEEEDETTVSESSENMWELNLGASATTSIPSWNHHQSEEDSVSLKQFFKSLRSYYGLVK